MQLALRLLPNPMTATRQQFIALLERLAPVEGYNLTALDDVRLLRSNRPLLRTPVLYEPGIVIVAQGRKRGYLGDEVYVYDADHYLAVAVPVPFTMETDASEQEPLLAIYLQLRLEEVADLILQIDAHVASAATAPKGMYATRMDSMLRDTAARLLQSLSSPLEAHVLGRALVREIYFRVLTSEQGAVMRAALATQGHFGKIARALRLIHKKYRDPLTIEELAATARMSAATFHVHFKAVTNNSPMQYLKSIRLHQARLLMVRSGMQAAAAAEHVGYGSASQFSREFKRFFGLPPAQEAERLQRAYALPPRSKGSPYVSSH